MLLSELLRDIPLVKTAVPPETEITGVWDDSRRVTPGSLFVAVVGFETDGHRYIASALEKGAAAVLCQTPPEGEGPWIVCPDTRLGLALASANWYGRPAEKLRMIGVTGTNGKTTVTNLVKECYERLSGKSAGLVGTNRNMIGQEELETERTTPESRELQELFARMVEGGCSAAVMEVSSHSLALERVAGIPFEVGVFTNLTQDHLDFHITMENYCDAKAILFQNCRRGVVNVDDPWASRLTERASCALLTVSAREGAADLSAAEIRYMPDGVAFTALYQGERVPVLLHIPGRFSVYNALSALGTLLALGFGLEEAAAALEKCHGVKGRVEVVPTPGKDYTLLIDYAHTPDAIENVLRAVKETAPGRVGILFGCGGDRDRTKRPKMAAIAAKLADYLIVTSDNPRTEDPEAIIAEILTGLEGATLPYTVIPDRREAIRWAMEHAEKDDVIILAGKGHETYQIIGKTKHHMDEREIVADVLKG